MESKTLQQALMEYGYTNVKATVEGGTVILIVNNGTSEHRYRIEGDEAIQIS